MTKYNEQDNDKYLLENNLFGIKSAFVGNNQLG